MRVPHIIKGHSLLMAFTMPFAIVGQNLIPNGGFEILDDCPNSQAEIYLSPPWQNAYYTPDLFHTCITYCGPPARPCVPLSMWGYQYPRTGEGYGGFWAGSPEYDYREFMYVELLDTLQPGEVYQLHFYVNRADNFRFAISSIGAYFTSEQPTYNDSLGLLPDPVGLLPQVHSPPDLFIGDTVNWVPISGTFCAEGGERFMIVGYFTPYSEANYQDTGGDGQPTSYYLVDDFELIQLSPCNDEEEEEEEEEEEQEELVHNCTIIIPNVFTPNDDGSNDVFLPVFNTPNPSFSVHVYNRWGQTVFANDSNASWDGRTRAGLSCPEGVYYYIITETSKCAGSRTHSGHVTLLR